MSENLLITLYLSSTYSINTPFKRLTCSYKDFFLQCEVVYKMNSPCALQIVKIQNHKFKLNDGFLIKILQNPEIRDRKVVVISVAGAFRKGKSFLLGFFLRYLYAQVRQKLQIYLSCKIIK